jgi:hypothetical protein
MLQAGVLILDAGHFVLDVAADQIAALIQVFVASSRATSAGAGSTSPAK